MPKPSVYIETSVISYLAARPSKNIVIAARQQITRGWWNQQRNNFDVFVSQFVIDEARAGDPAESAKRLTLVAGIPLLAISPKTAALAHALIGPGMLPKKASDDALHVAVASVHELDYLLTWNCKHIANAFLRRSVSAMCWNLGYECPVLCTPDELVGVIS